MELLEVFSKYLPHANAIFIRGSRAEGFAAPTADIDAIVVTDDPQVFNRNREGFDVFHWNNVNVEVLVTTKEELYKRLNVLQKTKISQDDLDEAERILSAKIVHGSMDQFDFSTYHQEFHAKYISTRMERCRRIFSKIKSDYSRADYQLLHLCRKHTLSMIEAYLVSKGDIFTRERWLFNRLDRTLGKNSWLAKRYIQLLFQQACLTPHDIHINAKQLLSLAQGMQYAIISGDHDNPAITGEDPDSNEPCFFLSLGSHRASLIFLNDFKVAPADECLNLFKDFIYKSRSAA